MSKNRVQYWAAIISEQENSGQKVRRFCQERGVGEHSFYMWRARLRGKARQQKKAEPVRFALVERGARSKATRETPAASLELLLPSGERLRIERGVDAETLRLVLAALRA
jgi:putative transposase